MSTATWKRAYEETPMPLRATFRQSWVSVSSVQRIRISLGYTYKVPVRDHRTQRPCGTHPLLDDSNAYGHQSIALDESAFISTDMPRRGWAKKASRLPKPPPTSKNRIRYSLLLGVTRDGLRHYEIKRGSFNGSSYTSFIETLPNGLRVLADNASIHKTKSVRTAAGNKELELIHTPPYCPWFNPVEYCFSEIKRKYRQLRVTSSSDPEDDIRNAIVSTVTPAKCSKYFDHCDKLLVSEKRHREYHPT